MATTLPPEDTTLPGINDNTEFHWADWVIFSAFLLISLGIGLFQGLCKKQEATTEAYHMGNRDFNIWPVALSLLSAFLSAILILGTPAEIYTEGTQYWVYVFGMMASCVFAVILFVPLLYPLRLTSSYEYLELRFKSKAAKITGSIILIVMQMLYMGICLYSPATALEAATGFPTWGSIIIGGCIAIAYVTLGGMKASVWTSAFQAFVMALGVIIVIIKGSIDLGGFGEVWAINERAGRVEFFVWDPSPLTRHSFWTLVVGGTVGWMSTYGVNQASVQRYSAVPTIADARKVLLLNIPGLLIMVSICCMAGMVLFAWYDYVGCDPLKSGLVDNSNQVLPFYVMDRLGYLHGIPGLFLASLFAGALSTMSSSLGAVVAVTWEDMLKKPFGHFSDATQTLINKGLTLIYGVGAIGMAFMAQNLGGTVLQASLSFTGAAGGPLLGLFFLGGCFPCANWIGAVSGGLIGLAFPLWISFGAYGNVPYVESLNSSTYNCVNYTEEIPTAFPPTADEIEGINRLYLVSYLWYPAIGASTCVVVGLLVSLLTGCSDPDDLDPKYNMPFMDRLCCCLPNKSLEIMRCKLALLDPEDIRADVDHRKKVEAHKGEEGYIDGYEEGEDTEHAYDNKSYEKSALEEKEAIKDTLEMKKHSSSFKSDPEDPVETGSHASSSTAVDEKIKEVVKANETAIVVDEKKMNGDIVSGGGDNIGDNLEDVLATVINTHL